MSRSYGVALAALTVGVPAKWIDNLLSHHDLPGIKQGRQGVSRRISEEGLLAIEVTRQLVADMGLPIFRASQLTRSALAARSESATVIPMASGMELSIDLNAIEKRLRKKVVEAIDSVPHVSRGRPVRA